jgi:hypothetical protein
MRYRDIWLFDTAACGHPILFDIQGQRIHQFYFKFYTKRRGKQHCGLQYCLAIFMCNLGMWSGREP